MIFIQCYYLVSKIMYNIDLRKQVFLIAEKISERSRFVNKLTSQKENTIKISIQNTFPCKQISLLQKVFHESSRLLESFFDRELLHFALTFFAHPSNIIKQKLQDKNTFLG